MQVAAEDILAGTALAGNQDLRIAASHALGGHTKALDRWRDAKERGLGDAPGVG